MFALALPLASAVGSVCTLIGMVPQVVRTLRSRSTDGLAPVGLWLSVVVNAAWVGYSYAVWDVAMLALNTVTALLAVAVLLSYCRHSSTPLPLWLNLAGAASLAGVAGLTAEGLATVLSATVAVAGFVVGLPQLIVLLRRPGAGGVAVGTYLIGIAGAVAWTVRWGLVGNPAVTLSSLYGVVVNVTGLVLLRYRSALTTAWSTLPTWATTVPLWPTRRMPVTDEG